MFATVDGLEQRLFQLETLYEIGRECAGVQTVAEALQVTLSMVMGAFGATRGLIFTGDVSGRVEASYARGLPDRPGTTTLAAESLARMYLVSSAASTPDGAFDRDTWLQAADLELCLPFTVDPTIQGAMALGSRLGGAPYTAEDRALLQTIISNAAIHLSQAALLATLRATADELEQKVHALSVVNHIALGITSRPGAQRLHRFLVEQIASSVHASHGALYALAENRAVSPHSLFDGSSDPVIPQWVAAARFPLQDGAGDEHAAQVIEALTFLTSTTEPMLPVDLSAGQRPEILIPIRYGGDMLGALWLRRDGRAFSAAEQDLLGMLANATAVVLENSRLFDGFLTQQQEQFRMRAVLEQYLAPTVVERVLSGDTGLLLTGSHLPVSIVRVDMRGSTQLVNAIDVDAMVALMNQYFALMTDILFRYEGTIDRFDGDAVVGFFGAPESHPDDPLRAVRTGIAMLREFDTVLADWRRRQAIPDALGVGVGIATGEVVVGNIGSAKRLHYTVSGPTANLAARLMAKAPKGTILMDQATWQTLEVHAQLRPRARSRRPRAVRAKGFAEPVSVYRLAPTDLAT
jgi:class 3 adenylate cyclase